MQCLEAPIPVCETGEDERRIERIDGRNACGQRVDLAGTLLEGGVAEILRGAHDDRLDQGRARPSAAMGPLVGRDHEGRRAGRIGDAIEKALQGQLKMPDVVAKRAPPKGRLKAHQCSTDTSPRAMARKLVRRASLASKS